MMDYRCLYQAVKYAEVRPKKPCFCETDAWLSSGYYFWDTIVDNAHWWGKVHYSGNYMIGKTACDKHSKELYDLVGDLEERKKFFQIRDKLIEKTGKELLVSEVIGFLRKCTKFENEYKAVRAYPCKSKKEYNSITMRFSLNNKAYMSLSEPYQICVFDLAFLEKPFEIIYSCR